MTYKKDENYDHGRKIERSGKIDETGERGREEEAKGRYKRENNEGELQVKGAKGSGIECRKRK